MLIAQKILQMPSPPEEEKRITYIIEEDLGDAYEKLGIQAFYVDGSGNLKGLYLIKNGQVELSISDQNDTSKICLADIDQDKTDEIIVFEGGISDTIWKETFGLRAYKTEGSQGGLTLAYENIWTYKDQNYALLGIRQSGGATPELYGDGNSRPDGIYPPTKSYGPIKVQGEKLVPTDAENFPFVPM